MSRQQRRAEERDYTKRLAEMQRLEAYMRDLEKRGIVKKRPPSIFKRVASLFKRRKPDSWPATAAKSIPTLKRFAKVAKAAR